MSNWFMNGSATVIINADRVERFCIVEKEDAFLVIASYGQDKDPLTIGRYQIVDEAEDALDGLLSALSEDGVGYAMRANTGPRKPIENPRDRYHGKKLKRRGGS